MGAAVALVAISLHQSDSSLVASNLTHDGLGPIWVPLVHSLPYY